MKEETRTDTSAPEERRRVSVAEALARVPGAGGERFAKVLEHGTLVVEIAARRINFAFAPPRHYSTRREKGVPPR